MLFSWKLDPHPPPRNANNIEHYTFVTLFSGKSDTPPPPSALRNTWIAPEWNEWRITLSCCRHPWKCLHDIGVEWSRTLPLCRDTWRMSLARTLSKRSFPVSCQLHNLHLLSTQMWIFKTTCDDLWHVVYNSWWRWMDCVFYTVQSIVYACSGESYDLWYDFELSRLAHFLFSGLKW